RRDQRRQAKRAAQWAIGDALNGPVDERGEEHGDDEHDEQRDHERADAEPSRQKQESNERDEGGDHEYVAMREVHHADDSENHRVADGNKAIDRTERNAVDELLDEDFHARAPRRGVPRDPATIEALAGGSRASNGGTAVWVGLWEERAGAGMPEWDPIARPLAAACIDTFLRGCHGAAYARNTGR